MVFEKERKVYCGGVATVKTTPITLIKIINILPDINHRLWHSL